MSVDTTDLATTLNAPQLEAVTAPDGPLLVFAGAGSGKTRVLTYRIAHLIQTGRVHPDQVLAVTFTNKAAREMRDRVAAIVGPDRAPAWMGTFHSICGRILRRDGQLIGIDRSYVIYDEADRLAAMKRAMQKLGLDEKRFPPGAVVQKISHAKNEMLGPEEFAAAAADYFSEVVGRVYPIYEMSMRSASALDFDDMLLMVVRLFRRRRGRWRSGRGASSTCWSTSTRTPTGCSTRWCSCSASSTATSAWWATTTSRSTVSAAPTCATSSASSATSPRPGWSSWSRTTAPPSTSSTPPTPSSKASPTAPRKALDRGRAGRRVMLAQVYDEQEEAEALAGEVRRLIGPGGDDLSLRDIAVLYRTNAQSRALEETLVRQGIPYKLIGGVRFYERREIKDALAYLRLVFNPSDVIAFRRIVNVPRRKIGDRTVALIEAEATAQGGSLSDVLREPVRIPALGGAGIIALTEFRDLVDGLRSDLEKKVPLPDLIEDMLVRTGLQRMYNDGTEEGADRWQNLLEFKGLASEYTGLDGAEALARMLEDAALVSDVDDLDESKPGLTLITLHMVKGLEFPVVFMVGMEEGLLPHLRAIEEPGGVDEERRLCYVGMTRAMRRLYLFHAFRRHLFGVANLNLPSRFLAELPEAIIERPAGSTRPVPGRSVLDQVSRRPPAPAEPVVQRYREGQRVKHRTFGAGVVVKSTLTRSDEELIVRFDNVGIKIISASLAPLEVE